MNVVLRRVGRKSTLRWLAGGLAILAGTALRIRQAHPGSARTIGLGIILVGAGALAAAMIRLSMSAATASSLLRSAATGRDLWARIWLSAFGWLVFRVAGAGVTPAPAREAAGALDRLLEEVEAGVSPSERPAVYSARARLESLLRESAELRTRERELERSIAEAGARGASVRLNEARVSAQAELAANAAAIDSLRIQLLLVRSGVASPDELR